MSDRLNIDGTCVSADHFIGGRWVESETKFEVFSPIDQRVLGHIGEGSASHVSAAIEASLDAFPAWAALSAAERKPYLDCFAEEIGKRAEELARLESIDAGVLLSRMRHGVVKRAQLNITYFAQLALTLQDKILESSQAKHLVRHDPAGVAAIITPWNSPLMLATWKLGPALASGNTCVLKPPEWAPLTSSMLADAAQAAGLPPGVFNVVQGTGSVTGAALVGDARIARVSFTGSVPTARSIAASAAAHLVPCSLELGGKSPFIVLEDADIDNAAATAALMYRNAGQVCLAGTRLLVHEKVSDRFVETMRRYVSRLVIGDPRDAATEVGPIIHPRQLNRVSGYVARARSGGADVLWGGEPHPYGPLYYRPTLITRVDQADEIVQNEVFGPVLTLQTFSSDEEAIALANGTDYGLGGVCYGRIEHATAVAEKVRTGFIWINSFGIRDLEAPFGGIKRSGIGREGGAWSFDFFCDVKDIVVPTSPFRASFSQR